MYVWAWLVLLRVEQQHDAEVELVARADQVLPREPLQQLARLDALAGQHQRVGLRADQHDRVRLADQPRRLDEVGRRDFAVADLERQDALLQGQPRVRREELDEGPHPQGF
jgi:hypothetical protein